MKRASILKLFLIISLSTMVFPAFARAQTIKVTLLGTGAPAPVIDRFGPSILVEAGDQKLIFDVGRGALQRLTQARVKPKDITGVFFTHLHSDHTVGFPDLWLTGWLYGRRDTPLNVWGPAGTQKMMSYLVQAFDFDIKIRIADDHASPDGAIITAKDIAEGVVYEKNGVKVTVFDVDHAPVKPAFGYRIDFGGHSVVLSGDTRPSDNLVKFAKGVDVVIHEVASVDALTRAGYPAANITSITGHHTSPEQAGELFTKIKPKLAVFSHIVPPMATEQDVLAGARKSYTGPLELGEDLMVIEIGDKVEVHRPGLGNVKSK